MQMNKSVLDIFERANILRENANKKNAEEKTIPVIQAEELPRQNNAPTKYIGVTGIQIREDGTITKDNYLKNLQVDPVIYENMHFTEEEIKAVAQAMRRQSSGINSSIPIRCTGDMCPFKASCPYMAIGKPPLAKPCQPPGSLVLTANRGYVPIESLDNNTDKLISYGRGIGGSNQIRVRGRHFKQASRHYDGELIKLSSGEYSYECTAEHICISQWNESSKDLFVVYMMQSGNNFRIGKTKLFLTLKNGGVHSGLGHRCNKERADSAWILGYFKTNTEASLAEEYFSCMWSIPKSCFVATEDKDTKWDGLYKWVTQDQLNDHFKLFNKPICEYDRLLRTLGLRYDYPIWTREDRLSKVPFRLSNMMPIRACNIVSKYMDIPLMPYVHTEDGKRSSARPIMSEVTITRRDYVGPVYSLEVEKDHTYISDKIITHNCLVEAQLVHHWTEQYIDEFKVDPANITELHMVSELAEFNIYEMRITKYLAENHPTLMQDVVVGVDANGNAIENQEIAKGFELKDRIKKNRMKVLESLMATRKEKMKVISEVVGGNNTMSKLSELKTKIASLSQEVRQMRAVDAEFVEVK